MHSDPATSSQSDDRGRRSYRPAVDGREAAVSSGHPLASLAAMRVLDAGGNAIDAAVAAGMALGVLQPDIVGFTGVAPIILYLAEDEPASTSFQDHEVFSCGAWCQGPMLPEFLNLLEGDDLGKLGPTRPTTFIS